MSECFSIVSDLPFKEDVLYFQNIINEYEMALKKSNQNIFHQSVIYIGAGQLH